MSKKYSIGIGLNLFDARAILLREDLKVIAEVKKKRININANETLEILLELFEGIVIKSKKYRDQIKGIGLALGGIVSNSKGVVYWPQDQSSYVCVPLKDFLEKKFGFPVCIENDATACAWAEYRINFSKYENIVYMFSGVGCGLVCNSALYRGSDGGAGELFLNSKAPMSSHLGDFSFFKQWPVDLNMMKRVKELISQGKDTGLVKRISSTGEFSLEKVFAEAEKKDKVAREIVKEAAFALGVKISFLINLLNPEAVIIGGGLEKSGEYFLSECSNTVKRFAFNEMRKICKISFSQLGAEATSQGAAMLVFEEKSLQR